MMTKRYAVNNDEPQWWAWLRNTGEWTDHGLTQHGVYLSQTYITVYGTTADRDAKRDALLAAAHAADMPEATR